MRKRTAITRHSIKKDLVCHLSARMCFFRGERNQNSCYYDEVIIMWCEPDGTKCDAAGRWLDQQPSASRISSPANPKKYANIQIICILEYFICFPHNICPCMSDVFVYHWVNMVIRWNILKFTILNQNPQSFPNLIQTKLSKSLMRKTIYVQ